MNEDAIRNAMNRRENDDLVAIATGLAEGYTSQAQALAEEVLNTRGVALPSGARVLREHLDTTRREQAELVAEVNTVQERASSKSLVVFCFVVGGGSFVLPLAGYQFRLLAALGPAVPIVGAVLVIAGIILLFGLRPKQSVGSGRSAAQ